MLSKGGNKHTRTLNNTEWGGGGGREAVQAVPRYTTPSATAMRIQCMHYDGSPGSGLLLNMQASSSMSVHCMALYTAEKTRGGGGVLEPVYTAASALCLSFPLKGVWGQFYA